MREKMIERQEALADTDNLSTKVIQECTAEVIAAFAVGSIGWRSVFPSRNILNKFSRGIGVDANGRMQRPFLNRLITRVAERPERLPSELLEILQKIEA